MTDQSIAAIVVAAGKGERVDPGGAGLPKQYRPIAGTPVLQRSIEALLAHPMVGIVLPVIHRDHGDLYARLALPDDTRLRPPIIGADTRQASVLAGLEALVADAPTHVLIHDAARPFVIPEVIGDVISVLDLHEGALPALALTETVKRSNDGMLIEETLDRRQLFAAQTPQGFAFLPILKAHRRAAGIDRVFTDDAEIAEWAGMRVAMVFGDPDNFKITHAADFLRAEQLIAGDAMMETRIGTGYDVHPFEPGEAVWLGGVRIPFEKRLKGHSDADVALHALADAIYGAVGAADIGHHFPPSEERWRGAPSRLFIEHAAKMVADLGGRIVNLDITIVAEAPRIGPHVPAMRLVIAEACGINPMRVAIKATTNERLGFIGREEGVVAMAAASIELPRED